MATCTDFQPSLRRRPGECDRCGVHHSVHPTSDPDHQQHLSNIPEHLRKIPAIPLGPAYPAHLDLIDPPQVGSKLDYCDKVSPNDPNERCWLEPGHEGDCAWRRHRGGTGVELGTLPEGSFIPTGLRGTLPSLKGEPLAERPGPIVIEHREDATIINEPVGPLETATAADLGIEPDGTFSTFDTPDAMAPPDLAARTGWACRVCGCTPERACEGGCAWAAENLCTKCAAGSFVYPGTLNGECISDVVLKMHTSGDWSANARAYVAMTLLLDQIDNLDDGVAEVLRDRMDPIWHALEGAERERLRDLLGDLLTLDPPDESTDI